MHVKLIESRKNGMDPNTEIIKITKKTQHKKSDISKNIKQLNPSTLITRPMITDIKEAQNNHQQKF
ncbi:unnamed protein product [Paramecium primaurelia]|uniref:Uncharacterized protein n=1 Tax=Paramecium primaurelia TaxID=5886 RepID=A0A8S1KKR4_PARPR|nr:unnamed protein product [Paramecium primaurelia]